MEQENNNNPTSETDPNSPTHKKHEAMLHRLSLLHQPPSIPKHQQQQPDSDSISSFLSLFSSRLSSIQSHLSLLLSNPNPNPNPKSSLDEISASISDLEQLLAQNSYYLPSYDLRSSLSSILTLKQSLTLASSQLLPKQKFSFKNKSKSKSNNKISKPSTAPIIEPSPSPSPATAPDAKKPSPGFRSKKGATLVKNFRVSEVEFTISDLDSCVVYLKGKVRALFIDHVKNCRIFCGPVLGSVLIEEVSGCLFVLASHQIRIHRARETDFYLRVRSRPIIEDCGGVRFGPYRLRYEGIEEELRESRLGEETGNWANVDDFKWLRALQSPNWCVIPEEEWVEPVDASDC